MSRSIGRAMHLLCW